MVLLAGVIVLWVTLFLVNTRVARKQELWSGFAYTDVLMFYTLNIIITPVISVAIVLSLLLTSDVKKGRYGIIKRLLNPAVSEYVQLLEKQEEVQNTISAMQKEYSTYSSLNGDTEDATEHDIFDSKISWIQENLQDLKKQELQIKEKLVTLRERI